MRPALLCLIGLAADSQIWQQIHTQALALRQHGHYREAHAVAQRALDHAETDTEAALALNEIAAIHQSLGQFWDAERCYLRALRILERSQLQEPLAKTLNDLATLYLDFGQRYAEAEQLQRRAIRVLGPRPELHLNLAAIRALRGATAEARALYEDALPQLTGLARASALANLAVLSEDPQRLARSIALFESVVGRDHPHLVVPLLNQGDLYARLLRPHLAEPLLRRAQAIVTNKLGDEHPLQIAILSTLAKVLRQTGRKKEAKQLERRVRVLAALPRDQAIAGARVHVTDLGKKR
jgi:tetratricopeptide (TPR) repeat protein